LNENTAVTCKSKFGGKGGDVSVGVLNNSPFGRYTANLKLSLGVNLITCFMEDFNRTNVALSGEFTFEIGT